MNSPFKTLRNIQTTFSFVRTLSILTVIGCLIFSGIVSLSSLQMIKKEREKIYVLDRGRSLILALQQDLAANRPVEARDHVRMFHEFFFNLSPDDELIKSNIRRAIELADKSAYNYFVDLSEAGYYRRLLGANIIQTISVDSIACDFEIYPYHTTTYATLRIIRDSRVTKRNLISTCELVNVPRSDNNPHGFLLQNFYILENNDLENETR